MKAGCPFLIEICCHKIHIKVSIVTDLYKSFLGSIKANILLWLFTMKANMSRRIALVKLLRTFINVDANKRCQQGFYTRNICYVVQRIHYGSHTFKNITKLWTSSEQNVLWILVTVQKLKPNYGAERGWGVLVYTF